MRTLTCTLVLVCGILFPAWTQIPNEEPSDPGSPPTIYVSRIGSGVVCAGSTVSYTAYEQNDGRSVNCAGGSWVWSTDDPAAVVNGNGTWATVTWATGGSHTVTARLDPCYQSGYQTFLSGSLPVTVQSGPTPPAVSIYSGAAGRVSASGATICDGGELTLSVPANASYTWQWSGSYITSDRYDTYGNFVTIRPKTTTTYTLTATPASATVCPMPPVTYTITVLPRLAAPVVAGTTGFGTGPLTLRIANPHPGATYTWYETSSGAALTGAGIGPNGTTFTTPSLASGRDYFVSVSAPDACEVTDRTTVPVNIYQVEIRDRWLPITGPLPLTPGEPVRLWAYTQGTATTYTWRLDGQVVQQTTDFSYNATSPGLYTVEVDYGSGSVTSQEVVVISALQDQTVNGAALSYINTIQVLRPNVTNPDQLEQLPKAERRQSIAYTDGLGRLVQQVAVQASPTGGDVVKPVVYDQQGGTPHEYAPFATPSYDSRGRFVTDYATRQTGFYQWGYRLPVDARPYSTTTAEDSPLGRVVATTKPGQNRASHPATSSYETNAAAASWEPQAVRLWRGLVSSEVYAANELTKQVVQDEDGRRLQVFRDKLNRVVLQRKVLVSGAGTEYLDTYTVYDDNGRVRAVIPPGAVEKMRNTGNWNASAAAFAARWLYQYTYDNKGRVVERQFPGAAPVYIVYDQFDRPILVQDGNRRAAGAWYFTKYDEANRVAVEGVYNRSASREDLQDEADDPVVGAGEFETRANGGYTTTATYPAIQDGVNGHRVLSVQVYDDYNLDQTGGDDYDYQPQTLPAGVAQPVRTDRLLGRPTVTRKRVVNSGNQDGGWLTTALFYDQYGNIIQKQSTSLLNTLSPDVTTLVYREQGFVPQVLHSIKQQATGSFNHGSVVVRNRFTYDHRGNVVDVWQQNSLGTRTEPEVLLSRSSYNELGQLIEKNLHSRDAAGNYYPSFLQSVDYRYNLLGQITHINNSALTADYQNNDDDNDVFGMEILRDATDAALGNTALYGGGISAIRWQAHNPAQQNNPERERSYRFTYDGLGRLRDAEFAAKDAAGTWSLERGAFDEKNIQYDANGNITRLERYTQRWNGYPVERIDDLRLYYGPEDGNRIVTAYDAQNDSRGLRNVTATSAEWQYDANGSVISDPNKGVTYRYNLLNKTDRQASAAGSISYDYDAAGTVLRRTITGANAITLTYVDGLVYEASTTQSQLSSVPTPEGRALLLPGATQFTYEYHLRDHLGNLRVAFRAEQQHAEIKVASEDPAADEEQAPGVQNVYSSLSPAGISYHGASSSSGNYASAVTAAQPGPSTRIPVSQGAQLKVSLWYSTPNGVQYYRAAPAPTAAPSATVSPLVILAPALLSTVSGQPAASDATRSKVVPGVQLSVTGLLASLTAKRQQAVAAAAKPGPGPVIDFSQPAYVEWRLYNDQNQLLKTERQVAPVLPAGTWDKLRFVITPDLSGTESKNGFLEVRLLNAGSLPVYYDSLTIRHPEDKVLVSQENHYYPFGLGITGVAVNTYEAQQASNSLFNGGSEIQDEVLGAEGTYSTFYRNYDPITGRFQSVDPRSDVYSSWSPYQFAMNNPIQFNDPLGDLTWEELVRTIQNLWAATPDNGASSWNADSHQITFGTVGDGFVTRGDGSTGFYINGQPDYQGGGPGNIAVWMPFSPYATPMAPVQSFDDKTLSQLNQCSDCVDPRTVGHNLLWLTYPGGDNPLTYSGNYTYSVIPKSLAEYPAIGHDRRYDNLGVQGATGLLTDPRAIGADYTFVSQELEIAAKPYLDPVTRTQAAVLGIGLGIAALPKTLATLANPQAAATIPAWYYVSSIGVNNAPSVHKH